MIVSPTTGVPSAQVDFSPNATDSLGIASVSCSPASGSVFPLGTTNSITCTANNTGGATASCSFNVTVSDSAPPQMTCPTQDVTVTPRQGDSSVFVIYNDPTPSATDGSGNFRTFFVREFFLIEYYRRNFQFLLHTTFGIVIRGCFNHACHLHRV